jgi:hypothetical protein
MHKITRSDIQHIGDEETLRHFLEEKLNLPIPEGLTLEDITSRFSNFSLGLSGTIAGQVIDCQELSVSSGQPSGIFLIRFNNEQEYPEVLRAVAKSLNQWDRNSVNLRFICADENFRPFAFAYFDDSAVGNWQKAVLNIFAWTQDNTHIHTSFEHELPAAFFANEPAEGFDDGSDILENEPENHTAKPTSPEALLVKLEKNGIPLGQQHWKIHSGIDTGCNSAFVIDESTRRQLINTDSRSADIIKLKVGKPQTKRWETELKHVIWIPSSRIKRWPWSGRKSEREAERIFAAEYPAISDHLHRFKRKIKAGVTNAENLYWWELPKKYVKRVEYLEFHDPKIIFYHKPPIIARYDTSKAFVINSKVHFIQSAELSLLAILNSKLFEWYVQNKWHKKGKRIFLNKTKVSDFPLPDMTAETQNSNLSNLVQQILGTPNSPAVSALEEEINMLVYDLYELTSAEIDLIEKGNNP